MNVWSDDMQFYVGFQVTCYRYLKIRPVEPTSEIDMFPFGLRCYELSST